MILPSAPLTLTLQPDNPSNTTLVDVASGKTLYIVKADFEPKAITRVRRANADGDGEVVASWEWRDIRSDVLTLGTAPPVSAST
ncbi:hypothetical protein HGRIS_003525 [Hohenbuehelia grisea]|uniref:DUF6593 domain-containing protein n=1 Tax=Hohenbuehelia grisea TaxID=104357 RepID=A0ABR3JHE7_9AGAR